jgi:hypothetical protein
VQQHFAQNLHTNTHESHELARQHATMLAQIKKLLSLISLSLALTLEEKSHFSTCLKRLKVSFATIFDNRKRPF